jgi:hypothetical protein
MKKARTPWPVATRVQYIVAYEYVHEKWGLSARRFCRTAEVPYPTFARWWARWHQAAKVSAPRAAASRRAGRPRNAASPL